MKINTNKFRAKKGEKIDLKDWSTKDSTLSVSAVQYEEILSEHIAEMAKLHDLLYATDKYSLLLIFQAMDAAGKDGAIKHVMSGLNPQGCKVASFKKPSAIELQHDFLWRCTEELPERGKIGIFNRSYYEEVLVLRVHPQLLGSESLSVKSENRELWQHRYTSIVDYEKHLHRNNTRIIKFYLHLSKAEQKKRFLSRLEDPEKNWKLSLADIQERQYWKQYTNAYEECLAATNTPHSPWYIIPADDKLSARLIISQVILEALKELKLSFNKPDAERLAELKAIGKVLEP